MTSGLASASPGRAARPNKTPHVHVRVSTISFSFACCLADYGKTAARGALLSRHYIPAPEKIKCTSGKRDAVLGPAPLLFQKRTKGSLLRRHTAPAVPRAPGRLARHVAALHRVALDLHVTLRGVSRLRRIAEHAAALAAEALEARHGRGFREIVVGVLLGDLVDHACTFVEKLLLAGVPLHALEDELDPVHGGIAMHVSGLGGGTPRQHRQGKRDVVGRLHAF